MSRTARITITVLVATLLLASTLTLVAVGKSSHSLSLVRNASQQTAAQPPSSDLAAQLARGHLQLSDLDPSQQAQVAASTFNADEALNMTKKGQPNATSLI